MIKAIETIYNGYRFRSRLEARWAVFFDAMGIKYEYESEGYEDNQGHRYLPDFRLSIPGWGLKKGTSKLTNLFVEVKGDPMGLANNWEYWEELHDYGGILPDFSGSCGNEEAGLILLGDIPQSGSGLTHFHPIIQHDSGLYRNWFMFYSLPSRKLIEIINEGSLGILCGVQQESMGQKEWMIETKSISLPLCYPNINQAYDMARQARFEHGETPVIR